MGFGWIWVLWEVQEQGQTWWVSKSHPRGTGAKPAPTTSQPSHFCFLTEPVFIYNVNKKKKKEEEEEKNHCSL
jgi:hypothetical protein